MSIRYLIAAALMASACAAHADVLPSTTSAVGNGASMQALYDKVSASVGSNTKVSLKQGPDGVYVKGLSTAKALALAGDGMSVISTQDGFKIVEVSGHAAAAVAATPAPTVSNAAFSGNNPGLPVAAAASAKTDVTVGSSTAGNTASGAGTGVTGTITAGGTDLAVVGSGAVTANVPEPSSIALMLAGMLGVAGLSRRRSR